MFFYCTHSNSTQVTLPQNTSFTNGETIAIITDVALIALAASMTALTFLALKGFPIGPLNALAKIDIPGLLGLACITSALFTAAITLIRKHSPVLTQVHPSHVDSSITQNLASKSPTTKPVYQSGSLNKEMQKLGKKIELLKERVGEDKTSAETELTSTKEELKRALSRNASLEETLESINGKLEEMRKKAKEIHQNEKAAIEMANFANDEREKLELRVKKLEEENSKLQHELTQLKTNTDLLN